MGDEQTWRYIGTLEGYSYSEDYDFADIEGMLNGKIKMHVWITWDEQGKITSISTLYVNPEDGEIYDYSVLPDGQVKEGPIM